MAICIAVVTNMEIIILKTKLVYREVGWSGISCQVSAPPGVHIASCHLIRTLNSFA